MMPTNKPKRTSAKKTRPVSGMKDFRSYPLKKVRAKLKQRRANTA